MPILLFWIFANLFIDPFTRKNRWLNLLLIMRLGESFEYNSQRSETYKVISSIKKSHIYSRFTVRSTVKGSSMIYSKLRGDIMQNSIRFIEPFWRSLPLMLRLSFSGQKEINQLDNAVKYISFYSRQIHSNSTGCHLMDIINICRIWLDL